MMKKLLKKNTPYTVNKIPYSLKLIKNKIIYLRLSTFSFKKRR